MQRITTTSSKHAASQATNSSASAASAAVTQPPQANSQISPSINRIDNVGIIHFSQAQAIVWQIQFILNQITSKKALNQAANELESLSSKFGKDFDKYLLKELIDQIDLKKQSQNISANEPSNEANSVPQRFLPSQHDLKDPVKAQKDKNEPLKVQLLVQEMTRCCQKPDFLLYFGEIASQTGFSDHLSEFLAELTRRLKLSLTNQILVALSLIESTFREEANAEATKLLKLKLLDYFNQGRPEPMPDYALHRILYLLSTHPEMADENREMIQQYLIDSTPKSLQHLALRGALHQDLMFANTSNEDPSICLLKDGYGIDNLDKSYRMLEPWQLLIDLGHFSSYNYNHLLKILEDFKDIDEKTMARTLLQLAIHHTGCDDQASKIAQTTFEAAKKGDATLLRKDIQDKKNQISWSVDNLSRAFRELFSHLNWQKVFEALAQIPEDLSLDAKAFASFLQIMNKSKPQNLPYPLPLILQTQWANPHLQLSFIENSIQFYIEKKEKSINFSKAGERRQEIIEELTGVKEKVSPEFLHVWLSVDLVERLLILSDSHSYQRVRSLFEAPLKQMPEYLLLTLSLCKPTRGCLLLDELLSLLLPQFLGNHINSILVLQALWKNNQALMIRAVCELCRHDQRIMNLSRVLDITQEVKESLMPIVDCEDYYFAVNLAILAGKRDFLHYDVWLQRRITDVGTPFIKALLKYVKEHILIPIQESVSRGKDLTADQIELQKQQILERSHLSKEKLCITIENLQNLNNLNHMVIKPETKEQIKEIMSKLSEYFPQQFGPAQNSEEIDNEANDYFQKVFSAESHLVDQKISELIDTMQRFRSSEVKKEQEIYACMLHSLFDEYRFLHKYPNQYLEKIAKLFGAIIKNRIMDSTLQEIALKFVLEAFRREGKRMKFGVIVIRNILDMLPSFPIFFDGIYELRNNIANTDAPLIKDIEELYERTMLKGSARSARTNATTESELVEAKAGVVSRSSEEEAKIAKREAAHLQKINENEFLTAFQQNTALTAQAAAQQTQAASGKGKDSGPAKSSQKEVPAPSKGTMPPRIAQVPEFNPMYKVKASQSQVEPQQQTLLHSQQSQNLQSQAAEIVAAQAAQNMSMQQPPVPPITTQGLNPSSQAFSRKPQNAATSNVASGQSSMPLNMPPIQTSQLALSTSAPNAFAPSQPLSQAQPQMMQQQPLGGGAISMINARPFRPQPMKSPVPQFPPQQQQLPQQQLINQPPFNQQNYQLQVTLENKIQKAIQEQARVKLEDIIEDSNMQGPNAEQQEELRLITNSVGRNNFTAKLEQAKAIINQNPQQNLQWFLHFILTKKLSSSNLFPIYIDLIKQIGQRDSITQTIAQAVELFKKCMLIDEELFHRVSQRPQGQISLIKQYLCNLGSFIGQLTVAGNRPIHAKELDLKQLLVEGFQCEKMKYVIFFVCRILKECSKSTIFKFQNPWVRANLEILRELYDWSSSNNTQNYQNHDVILEIDGLFKSFGGVIVTDVKHTGFLHASVTRSFTNPTQQSEYMHMLNKPKIIPAVQVPLPPPQQPSAAEAQFPPQPAPSPSLSLISGFNPQSIASGMITPSQQSDFERAQLQQDISKIFGKIVISPDFLGLLGLPQGKMLSPNQEQNLRKLFADAVDQSITEILPPVVDRSVTIALITTRELVLKDFAFDPDSQKILKAANLIVQNLAGSLALVTCREPLKMQLTTNLKKQLQQGLGYFQDMTAQESNIQFPPLNEAVIQDLATLAGKDNLELGCKLIKKSVIQKALTKVREDQQIAMAIKQRQSIQSADEFKRIATSDEALLASFADLPQQLKPSPDGLTEAQFQVYEDFSRLANSMNYSQSIGDYSMRSTDLLNNSSSASDDIEMYLGQYEALPNFDKKFESQLAMKLQMLNNSRQDASIVEQVKKLLKFCENLFQSLCERIAAQQQQQQQHPSSQAAVNKIIDFLSFVTQNLRISNNNDDLQTRFTQQFLSFDSSYVQNTGLTLTLMTRGILSPGKWDSQIAQFVRESQQFNTSNQLSKEMKALFQFLKDFLEAAVAQSSINDSGFVKLTYQSFQNVMQIINKYVESDADVAQFFAPVIQDYRQRMIWTKEKITSYFNEWAIISFEEAGNPTRQEQEVNRFFLNLSQQGLYKDQKAMQKFCKTMLELSVERALYMNDGVTKRPADRLVYRYIESFLNLLVVLLKMFTSSGDAMNKNEFLNLVFEALYQVIDEDHRTKRSDFNQKPYYRILINLFRVIGDPKTFTQKILMAVQFSLADLFSKLNPKEYPAFSFAWLELISHKQFMPYFLQHLGSSNAQATAAAQQQQLQSLGQPRRVGGQMQPPQVAVVDNTNLQRQFKYKDLIIHLFSFLKNNMVVGQPVSEPLAKFYEATLRVILVIKNDYPEFLCDFHFNFVNSLPDHCVQLRNIILSAQPRNIPYIEPFAKNLKVDTLNEIQLPPRTQSNYENYLQFMNLREDLEKYLRTKDKTVIQDIAEKMMQSEEIVNGRKRVNSAIYNAVALFIQNYSHQTKNKQDTQKECYQMLKQILLILSSETRQCLLNAIVNELRYVNSHTYFYSWMIIFLFNDNDESVQEQITRILIERLQTHEPHPWGLCITFRELLQNPKYAFSKKPFVVRHMAVIDQLMQTKLEKFNQFWINNKQQMSQMAAPNQQQPMMHHHHSEHQ